MKKTELTKRARESYQQFLKSIENLSEDDATRIGVTSEWSAKDVLSHIVAWEFEGARIIKEILENNVQPPKLDKNLINNFNHQAIESRRNLSWSKVRAEFDESHREIERIFENLPDELDESTTLFRYTDILGIKHFAHHGAQIKGWRDKQG